MSASTRFLVQPSLRAMWSSTATLSVCCHRPLRITASSTSTTRLSALHSTHHVSATRQWSSSQRLLAASPASSASSASSSASASSEEPAAAVYRSIHSKLTDSLQPTYLNLEDTSGGCGTFFRLLIASPRFDGQSLVKQHRLVKQVIKEEIGGIHGLTIDTMTDAQYKERKKAADERKKAAGLPS